MKTTLVRFIVAGLIMASVGFLIYYYFATPDAALSTYNEITNLAYSDEYLDFDENLGEMNQKYLEGGELNNAYTIVNNALKNNFNYYKSYLLFVSDISATDQAYINSKINEYESSFLVTNQLLEYFNQSFNDLTKVGMHKNFIRSYNATIKLHVELIEALRSYVIKYSFNNAVPVGLRQTLLQVQLDFAKVVIQEELTLPENEEAPIVVVDATIIDELSQIINKYSSFTNSPQGTNQSALNFIDAYKALENKEDYFKNTEKAIYVLSLEDNVSVTVVHTFLTASSYN